MSRLIVRAGIRAAIGSVVICIIPFIAAGDWTWLPAWIYAAILISSVIVPLIGPFRLDEGLIEERMSPKPGAKWWDKYFVGLVGVFTIAELVVPGLDHRWGWSEPQALWKSILGFLLVILGTVGLIWAMRTNRFFSALIRIQNDRGHHVISEGPYCFIRHPGYFFWSLRTIGVPLLLASNWAFLVAGLFIATFVFRTFLEDRVLQNELPGYRDYAERVRWRLIKGVW